MEEQHIYHHYDNDGVRISMKAEKNTKGYNFECSVTGASTVHEAILTLLDANKELKLAFEQPMTTPEVLKNAPKKEEEPPF